MYLVKWKQHTGFFSEVALLLWLSACFFPLEFKGRPCLSFISHLYCHTTSEKPLGLPLVLHLLVFLEARQGVGSACCTALSGCVKCEFTDAKLVATSSD